MVEVDSGNDAYNRNLAKQRVFEMEVDETESNNELERFKKLILSDIDVMKEEDLKMKEQAILSAGHLLAKRRMATELADLIVITRPFLNQVSKAKAAKLVRTLVDLFLDLEGGTGREVDLCKECIDWSNVEKRTFLRQALQARLMGLYYDCARFEEALTLGSLLLKELKKLDDKALLVEVQLLESKVYQRLGNLQRSRAALTTARTTANGIYCPPKVQASLDMQSGILHAADERDFKTAYSYFYEAFEGYDTVDSPKAVDALKYMLLSKIMLHCADDVPALVSGKIALKYGSTRDVEAMRAIALAASKRSLGDFVSVRERYAAELTGDSDGVIKRHLEILYDELLEQNLSKLIEPYSRVQIAHLAKLINLPFDTIERKLSQMILDKKLNGILNHQEQMKGKQIANSSNITQDCTGSVLLLFDRIEEHKIYKLSLEAVHNLNKVVDQLYHKAKKLT